MNESKTVEITSTNTNTEKILIRNIPAEVFAALQELAPENNRSLEGEARAALRSWVAPHLMKKERALRRSDISRRLNFAFQTYRESKDAKIKVSHIAEAIGEQYASGLEACFDGTVEPSFEQVKKLAQFFGCSQEWLQWGDESEKPIVIPTELLAAT